jgi:hypothetical protein
MERYDGRLHEECLVATAAAREQVVEGWLVPVSFGWDK